MIKITDNNIVQITKMCLDVKYHKAVDYLFTDSNRRIFNLRGEYKICYYHETFLIIAIDTLDNHNIFINTNILQTKLFELGYGKKWDHHKYVMEEIEYISDMKKIIIKLRKDKLEKLNETRNY